MEEDNLILGKKFSFASELDSDGEMQLDVEPVRTRFYYSHYITRAEAIELATHLIVVFDIQGKDYDPTR